MNKILTFTNGDWNSDTFIFNFGQLDAGPRKHCKSLEIQSCPCGAYILVLTTEKDSKLLVWVHYT